MTNTLERIVNGRTDLVFEHVAAGHPVTAYATGARLIQWCARYGDVSAIRFLLAHGDAKDVNGDSPLSWASWHTRPDNILRLLCYGDFHVRADRDSTFDHGMGWGFMERDLLGNPKVNAI